MNHKSQWQDHCKILIDMSKVINLWQSPQIRNFSPFIFFTSVNCNPQRILSEETVLTICQLIFFCFLKITLKIKVLWIILWAPVVRSAGFCRHWKQKCLFNSSWAGLLLALAPSACVFHLIKSPELVFLEDQDLPVKPILWRLIFFFF